MKCWQQQGSVYLFAFSTFKNFSSFSDILAMAMIPDNEIRQKARERLKVKGVLEKLFFVALGFPFLLAFFIDRLITESNVIFWISIFFILSLINIIAWRCTNCEKQLSHLRRTDFSYIPRFCRHCGVLLFPEVPPKDVLVTRERMRIRPWFFYSILALGFIISAVGYIPVGGGMIFICLLVTAAVKNSTSRSCKSCGHTGIDGKFCDNCGAKYLR